VSEPPAAKPAERLLNNVSGVNSYLYRRDPLIKEFAEHSQCPPSASFPYLEP
jgi:hypothetical protein